MEDRTPEPVAPDRTVAPPPASGPGSADGPPVRAATSRSRRSFAAAVGGALRRAPLEILQVNLGKLCNQTCVHCHVNAGPTRTENMTEETLATTLSLLDRFPTITTVDVTGGAPEMNPGFRHLVRTARGRGLRVIDRCNLTILGEPGYEDLAAFLAQHEVNVVASLPCYLEENVDAQRGDGVFARSIEALRTLNGLGYGRDGVRMLDLVFNPVGTSLPPEQAPLEAAYKEQLSERFGITFDRLYTITNMVIARYESFLKRTGALEKYETLLESAFNPATLAHLMCRNTMSIGWDGVVYDCDFNQMLDLRLGGKDPFTVATVTPETWEAATVITRHHCFGCTAGTGSSCGGALT